MADLNLTIQPALAEALQHASRRHGINRCQIIRESIQLWLQIDEVIADGKRFFVTGNGDIKEIMLVGLTPAIRPGRQEAPK